MTRNLSLAARQSMTAQQTDVVWLMMLVLDHESLEEPLRFVNNTQNVVSNDKVYVGYPFMLTVPEDSEDRPPQVTLVIDNVDRSIVQSIRNMTSPPTVTLFIVTSEDYDQIEVGPFEFSLKAVDYDALTVQGTLAYEPILYEAYPAETFTPSKFPGLF